MIMRALFCSLLFVFSFTLHALTVEDLRIYPTRLVRTEDDGPGKDLPVRDAAGVNTYLTSATVAPWDSSQILVSTTFHGLYESYDGGETWMDLGDEPYLDALYRGSGFYEDVASVAYDETDRDLIHVELTHDGASVVISRSGRAVPPEAARPSPSIRTIWPEVRDTPEAAARRELAADHHSFYLSPWQVSPERLAEHLEFAALHGFTAVVVDFKDDLGRIVYDSDLEMHSSMGAVKGYFSADRVIQTVHDAGLYLIARIVVFKDRELYRYDGGRYALWDATRDEPWGVFRDGEQIEHWVDLFSSFVWDYNIAIARELVERGVDEIQFDYIRTPSDGAVRDIEYRHRSTSPAIEREDPFVDDRVAALSSFLARARERIDAPIGIDVFGFNGWYRMGYLGQDIGALSAYVDVISPMLYPSHFAREFAAELPYVPRAEQLYREGVARARRIAGEYTLIRPYVQSFLIGDELEFDVPTYTDYLKYQIRGALEGGASGFTLWNFSGRYYMVERGLWF